MAIDFQSEEPPEAAIAKLRNGFPSAQLPSLQLATLRPFPRGTYLLGDFRGSSVTLKVVDATAPILHPTFEGEVLRSEGGSRLVGTIRYDRAALALTFFLLAHFLGFVTFVFWSVSHSVWVTLGLLTLVFALLMRQSAPAIDAQREVLLKAAGAAGFTPSNR